jgi:phosphoribosylanthranilate isomerase
MPVRVKICGITNVQDALAAVDAGADALGFVFYEQSPRHLSYQSAGEIIRALPPFVAQVGVFVNVDEVTIRRAVLETGVDTLQFHGDESPEFCHKFATLKVYKAFRIQSTGSLAALRGYATDAWLLDSFVADQRGGTGAPFNWDLAVQAVKLGRPVILAGGLTPENVAQAVQTVRPFAVDVSSGVESRPGKKDHAKVRAFIQSARTA